MSDDGAAIASSTAAAFRERGALLPAIDTIERIGLAGRAIARRRAERALIEDIPLDRLQSLDRLLEVDPSISQTRFHWLRSAPEAPAASNLVGLPHVRKERRISGAVERYRGADQCQSDPRSLG
jgi:hypothetical protein